MYTVITMLTSIYLLSRNGGKYPICWIMGRKKTLFFQNVNLHPLKICQVKWTAFPRPYLLWVITVLPAPQLPESQYPPLFAQSGLSRLLFVWPLGLCISHLAQTIQPQWAIRPDINKSERLETNAGLWLDGMVMTWLGSNLSIDEQIVLFKGTTERG